MPTLPKSEISRTGPRVLSRLELREQPFPDAPGRTIDPAEVEREIDRLERENERASEEYEVCATGLAEAEHAWKLAQAQTIATGYGERPVSALEADALVAHADKHLAYKMARAGLDAVDKRCWAITHSLDALRSLNANVREQTR